MRPAIANGSGEMRIGDGKISSEMEKYIAMTFDVQSGAKCEAKFQVKKYPDKVLTLYVVPQFKEIILIYISLFIFKVEIKYNIRY